MNLTPQRETNRVKAVGSSAVLGVNAMSSQIILPLAIDSLLLNGVRKPQLTKPSTQSPCVLRQMDAKCNLATLLEQASNLQNILACVCADALWAAQPDAN